MSLLTIILASLAALEHLYIFYLESIRTTSDTTSRVFNMDKEELARPSVTSLFKNQGIYNALIGVFLLYGLFVSKNIEVVTIFVLFIIGAAAYGAMTANKKIILTQGGPAKGYNGSNRKVMSRLFSGSLWELRTSNSD